MTATKKAAKAPKVEQEVPQDGPAPTKKSLLARATEAVIRPLASMRQNTKEVSLQTRTIMRNGWMVILVATMFATVQLLDFWQWVSAIWAAGTVMLACKVSAVKHLEHCRQIALKRHSIMRDD